MVVLLMVPDEGAGATVTLEAYPEPLVLDT
jgi:hypothetical protein